MNPELTSARKPWIAVNLALICPGLGQIYCGRAGRGLILYACTLLFGPLLVALAAFAQWTPLFLVLSTTLAGLAGLSLWAVRDAARLARRAPVPFPVQEYQRPLVYTMLGTTNLLQVVTLAVFLRTSVIEAFVIPSRSMEPTFVPGDRILVSKLALDSQTLARGELVVYRNPLNRRQNFVKRVIGLPGETIAIVDGRVQVNGNSLPQDVVPSGNEPEATTTEEGGGRTYRIRPFAPDAADMAPVTVPDDAYFLLGDHRSDSLDSRQVGCIPHGLIIGRVKCIYWPGSRLGAPR